MTGSGGVYAIRCSLPLQRGFGVTKTPALLVDLMVDYQDAFMRSWDLVEESYISLAAGPEGERYRPVAELVREMRRRGYDRVFRAGMAAYNLVLSRSAEHGLRRDQRFVDIFVWPWILWDGAMHVSCGPGDGTRFVEERFALTPALDRALADLARAPID
jgi:hypothetical protein